MMMTTTTAGAAAAPSAAVASTTASCRVLPFSIAPRAVRRGTAVAGDAEAGHLEPADAVAASDVSLAVHEFRSQSERDGTAAATATASAVAIRVVPLLHETRWRLDAVAQRIADGRAGPVVAAVAAGAGAADPAVPDHAGEGSTAPNEPARPEHSADVAAVDAPANGQTLEAMALRELVEGGAGSALPAGAADRLSVPIMVRNRVPFVDTCETEEEKLRLDVAMRPDPCTAAEYEQMPVEVFGEAVLRGMGWTEGAPIGGVNKACVKPIEYVPRLGLLGLGATPRPPSDEAVRREQRRRIRPGETRQPRRELVAPPGPDQRVRHYRTVDEPLVERERLVVRPGAKILVRAGPHRDLYGSIVDVIGESRLTAKLAIGGAVVALHRDDVDVVSARDFAAHAHDAAHDFAAHDAAAQRDAEHHASWLHAHTRVRIISRSLGGGGYYERKVTVVDVTEPGVCLCRDDEGRLLEGVRQRDLETVVPRQSGALVMLLRGPHRGRIAELLERDTKRAIATVRLVVGAEGGRAGDLVDAGDARVEPYLSDEPLVLKLSFDDLAEYVR